MGKKTGCIISMIVLILVLFSSVAYQDEKWCRDLDEYGVGEIGVGEAIYYTVGSISDKNVSYANAYYDGGDELKLGWKEPSGFADLDVFVALVVNLEIKDNTPNDCADVEIRLRYCGSNTENPGPEGNCVANYTCYPDIVWAIDTCLLGGFYSNSFKYWGNTIIPTVYKNNEYWRWYAVDIHKDGKFLTGDAGCVRIFKPGECLTVPYYWDINH